MTPYKTALIRNQFYTLNDVVNAIKEVALIYDVPVLDLYNEGRYELEMYEAYSDGVHPTQEFFRQYTTPQIAEFIINNYN